MGDHKAPTPPPSNQVKPTPPPAPPAKTLGTIALDLRQMPEVVADMRAELARITRDVAVADADPRVAERLLQIADAFEAGQSPEVR